MESNPWLKRMGLSPKDRLVILHADDLGLSQASVEAFRQLFHAGLVRCGAVMVPCPWFPAAVKMAADNPGMDLGVHLTLTSEWEALRWGPISTRQPESGLIDKQGYFPRGNAEVHKKVDPVAAKRELYAQVETAQAAGLDVTHIDTHMGTVLHPRLMSAYITLALDMRLPALIPRWSEEDLLRRGLDGETAAMAARNLQEMEASGYPLIDREVGMPLDKPEDRLATARRLLGSLSPGITHFIFHPAVETPEMKELAGDWQARAGDAAVFQTQELRDFIRGEGLVLTGYREIRDLLRGA